jgi:hypothetical protein
MYVHMYNMLVTPEGIAVRSRHHTSGSLDGVLETIHDGGGGGDDGGGSPAAAVKRRACRSARVETGWWLACSIRCVYW